MNGAPVLRTALDEAVDSVEVFESELGERVDFLCPASDCRRTVGAGLFVGVLRWVCCNEETDSSDSSGLELA